jgi:hypothetical protein
MGDYEEKLRRSRAENWSGGICRVNADGSPRRGWMFCGVPGCIEVIRKRNGPCCEKHGGKVGPSDA